MYLQVEIRRKRFVDSAEKKKKNVYGITKKQYPNSQSKTINKYLTITNVNIPMAIILNNEANATPAISL